MERHEEKERKGEEIKKGKAKPEIDKRTKKRRRRGEEKREERKSGIRNETEEDKETEKR